MLYILPNTPPSLLVRIYQWQPRAPHLPPQQIIHLPPPPPVNLVRVQLRILNPPQIIKMRNHRHGRLHRIPPQLPPHRPPTKQPPWRPRRHLRQLCANLLRLLLVLRGAPCAGPREVAGSGPAALQPRLHVLYKLI